MASRATALSLVLVLALGCTSLGAAQSFKEVKLQFVELGTPSTQGDDGTNFGHMQFFRNPIADYNTGAILGRNSGFCVFTLGVNANGDFEFECSISFIFAEGTISLLGSLTNAPTTIPVVGGSGIYSGANGICQFSTLSNDDKNTNTFAYNCDFFVLSTPLSAATLGPKVGVAPVNGVCDSGSNNPSQCFAADGKSSICCPGGCPMSPTNTAACA